MNETLLPSFLRTAVMNQRMYPAGSPIVERSVSQIHQALERLLQSQDRVTLTNRQGRIFFLNKETADAANLVPVFEEHNIQSLTFLPGATAPEISQLVQLLSRKKLPDGNASEWLQNQNVTHVQLDKVTVVEVMEGEAVTKRVDMLFDQVHDFPELVSDLRESYDMMDKIPDERKRAEVQEHLARRLAGLESPLIRDMFENELPKRVEDSGLRDSVLNAMTQDKLRDIFSEIGDWYRQVRAQTSSDFEVVDHLNKLKTFLGKLLKSPAHKNIPFAIYEEMMNQGLLDQVPPDVEKQPEEESIASQVDKLLENPPSALLEQPVRDQLPFILKKLLGVGLDDLALKLVKKFIQNLTEGTPLLRQIAVRTSYGFLEIFWVNRNERLAELLSSSLTQLMEMERSTDVYRALSETSSQIVIRFILNDRSSDALKALSLLRRHFYEESAFIPQRPELAGQALQRVADNIIDVMTEDLLSPDKPRQESAQNILAYLGEKAIPCFINMIKSADDVRHRRLAAGALKFYGTEARNRLAAEFHVGNSTIVLLHVLSILDDFLFFELIPRFEGFLHFPDASVRRRIIQLTAKMAHENATKLLLKFLDDPDEPAQIEAVRSVGELRIPDAVYPLMDLIKSGSTLRLEEVCLALGKIGDGQCVPALMDLLESRPSGLFKKKSSIEETVRIRAAWALSQIKTDDARNALSRLRKDPNQQIQAIVKHALGS
ncbi:MAG: HEAT repeat domain-containing protein [Elusimicrobia bacterium]|nr:HEAT repeat domain-containing protein [Elusimicrobiota bacterium]